MNVRDIADKYGASTTHVRQLIKHGKLASHKVMIGNHGDKYTHQITSSDAEVEAAMNGFTPRKQKTRKITNNATRDTVRVQLEAQDFHAIKDLARVLRLATTTLYNQIRRRNLKKYMVSGIVTLSRADALTLFDSYHQTETAVAVEQMASVSNMEQLVRVEASLKRVEQKLDSIIKQLC